MGRRIRGELLAAAHRAEHGARRGRRHHRPRVRPRRALVLGSRRRRSRSAGRRATACTQDYEWTKVDGTRIQEEMPDTSVCDGRAIEVPPGTSIAIEAAATTRVTTTRTTTQFFEGDVGLIVSAEWAEGNATFVVPLTVTEATPDLELVVLDCRPGDQVEFSGPDGADPSRRFGVHRRQPPWLRTERRRRADDPEPRGRHRMVWRLASGPRRTQSSRRSTGTPWAGRRAEVRGSGARKAQTAKRTCRMSPSWTT